MKRILTIQDISCLGKCSVTISLPVLSAMGVETVILPTALFSTHTLFEEPVRRNLTELMLPVAAHWKKEGVRFDAIYTGYLGTEEEIDLAAAVIDEFREEDTLVLVDPVMGDNGRLYRGFGPSYAGKNTKLCAMADLILPNITEACLMTGIPYRERYDRAYIEALLTALSGFGGKKAALTGVSLEEGKTGVMGYDPEERFFFLYQIDRVPAAYHGTGDLFASVAAGALIRGESWKTALSLAADYTALTIRETQKSPKDLRFGVDFEKTLPELWRLLGECREE